ncbi:MAG: hypothetical protein ACLQU2_34815 [Candidatus Binataceae bacterium]
MQKIELRRHDSTSSVVRPAEGGPIKSFYRADSDTRASRKSTPSDRPVPYRPPRCGCHAVVIFIISSRTSRSIKFGSRIELNDTEYFEIKEGKAVESANRKLIRPSFNEIKEQLNPPRRAQQKKPVPPDQTNAENFYYVKQMQAKTPMVFVLRDGETLRGVIEWYDKSCLKVNRDGEPNLLLYKPNIKYMYKEEPQ